MERLSRLSLRHPAGTLILLVAVSALFLAGALRLETDVGYRSLLGRDHPSIARFDALLEHFGGGFPLAAVYDCAQTPRCDGVFEEDALVMAADIVTALQGEPSIRRVESPATTALLVPGSSEDLETRRFVEAGRPVGDREALARRALEDSLWPRQLVDREGTVGAIAIEVASSGSADNIAAYRALDAALAPHEAGGVRFHRIGGPVEFVVAGGELQADTGRLVPVMVILVGAVLLVMFRSASLTIAALVTVGVGVGWTFGLLGWLGWAQNSVTQALPPLLLVIGVCDVIHLLARIVSDAADHPDRGREALVLDAVRDVGPPCILTSLTTAAGFASFATSSLESFVQFGLAAAFGVMAALLLTFSLLPIAASRLPLVAPTTLRIAHRWDALLSAVVDGAQRHARGVLAGVALAGIFFGWGAASLQVDASFEDLYGEDSRVVQWARYVGDHLRLPDTLEVELSPPRAASLADPESLAVVEAAALSLAGIDELGPAHSAVDLVSLVHQLANDDDPFWHRLPGREEDVAEIFEQVHERDSAALDRWYDPVGRHFRVSIESDKAPQEVMRRILREARTRLAAELPSRWSYTITGPLAVVHDMIDEIQRTQLVSFGTAAAIVLVLVAVFLRSVKLAMLALVPTALPVVVTLGAMGWAGAALDAGSAMVAAVVLGIAVDDCIHVLSVYRIHRRGGTPRDAAMREAVLRVGRAVVTTSVSLAIGFFALTLSSWSTISNFGALAGVAISGALVAVVVVLPAWVTVGRG